MLLKPWLCMLMVGKKEARRAVSLLETNLDAMEYRDALQPLTTTTAGSSQHSSAAILRELVGRLSLIGNGLSC